MVEQRGLATSPVSSGETPTRENGSELGNAALPVLDSGQGGDVEVEEALAKLLAFILRDFNGKGEQAVGRILFLKRKINISYFMIKYW
jgi:hypothetical protein